MKLLFIVDPLDKLGLAGDTSYALMLEACARGWEVFTCQLEHLGMEHDDAVATAVRTMVVEAETPAEAFTVGDAQEFSLGQFDMEEPACRVMIPWRHHLWMFSQDTVRRVGGIYSVDDSSSGGVWRRTPS